MRIARLTKTLLGTGGIPLLLFALVATAAADDWAPTGSMSGTRTNHTASLLPDGRVLVAGGNGGSSMVASAEIYNPATGLWSTTGSLNYARSVHTATLLPDGQVLVTGGHNGSAPVATVELYSPGAGTWSILSPMKSSRHAHKATPLPDGRVLVTGGYTGSSFTRSAEIYDPASGSWTLTGSMNVPRHYHTANLLSDGRVLVGGGHNGSSPVTSAEIYDPASGAWVMTGSMSSARFHHTATLLVDDRVLATGGHSGSTGMASAEIYDLSSGTWAATGSMNSAVHAHTATLLPDGRVLVTGGGGGPGGNTVVDRAEYYDPATEAWSLSNPMGTARYFHTATLLQNGVLLVSGGSNGIAIVASAETYGAPIFQPPTAVAGPNQIINQGQTVHLDGSGSYGVNTPSSQLQYAWTFASRPAGSAAVLVDANTATPSFLADAAGTFVVRLIVTDPNGGIESAPSQVLISSTFVPPTANAGPAQAGVVGIIITLDGSASTDPNGLPLSYAWAFVARPTGSLSTLTGANTVSPSFTPDLAGSYTVGLVVSDLYGSSPQATVVVSVISGADFAQNQTSNAVNTVAALPVAQLQAPGHRNSLSNLLQQAIAALQIGDVVLAKSKLNAALSRTDGFPLRGALDGAGPGMDWITDPAAQATLYQALTDAISVLP